MVGVFSRRRRDFLTKGILATAAPLVGAQTAEAQAVNSGSIRVYRSGETIDDRVAKFKVDGWNVTYPHQSPLDYLGKTGRDVEVLLKGDRVIAGEFYEQIEINGERHVRLTAFPTEMQDRAYLHIFERERESGGYPDRGRIVREQVYPIGLDFTTFGDPWRRGLGGSKPHPGTIGVLSEAPLEQALLSAVHEFYTAFRDLEVVSPIYIQNFPTEDDVSIHAKLFGARDVYSSSFATTVPSFILTNPKGDKQEGFAKLYQALAEQLANQRTIYWGPDLKLDAQITEAREALMQGAGFDRDRWYGPGSPPSNEERSRLYEYQINVANNPKVKLLDLQNYLSFGGDFDDTISADPKHMYGFNDGLFASVMTVFRFFPEQFLEKYGALKPEERKPVAQVGKAVLDYFASYAPVGPRTSSIDREFEIRRQLGLVKVLPSYHVLRQELSRASN